MHLHMNWIRTSLIRPEEHAFPQIALVSNMLFPFADFTECTACSLQTISTVYLITFARLECMQFFSSYMFIFLAYAAFCVCVCV